MFKQLRVVILLQLAAIAFVWFNVAATSEQVTFFGFDMRFLLLSDLGHLKQFYPSLYWLIYLLARTVRIGLPVLAGLYVVFNQRGKAYVLTWLSSRWGGSLNALKQLLFPLLATLVVSLIAYWFVVPSSEQPVWFQRQLARGFLLVNIANLLLLVAFNFSNIRSVFKEFLFKPALPYALAITRILFFSYMIVVYFSFYFNHGADIGKLEKVSLPGIGWLIEILPINSHIYTVMAIAGAFFALMVAIGYRTRLFLILHALTIFYVVATPNFFGKLWHQQLPIWIAWIMACSPCADVLSLDAKLRRADWRQCSTGYSFHLHIIWLHFGLIYFFAGFYKLWESGFDWALSNSIVQLVTIEWFEHYDRIPSIRIDQFPLLLKIGGVLTILFELSYGFMLLGRRSKWGSVFGGLAMHNMIGYFMYISFFDMLQVFYMVYVPWNWFLQKLRILKDFELPKQPTPRWTKPAILIPVFILIANFASGVFKVDSYPFSIYPVYTDIVADSVAYLEYRILDHGKQAIDFRKEGKAYNFRWESYSRIEYAMIREYRTTGALDTVGVRTMWKRWQLAVPTLAAVDSVDIYIAERSLDPDHGEVHMENRPILRIQRTEGEKVTDR